MFQQIERLLKDIIKFVHLHGHQGIITVCPGGPPNADVSDPAVMFVLECLVKLPLRLCVALANQVSYPHHILDLSLSNRLHSQVSYPVVSDEAPSQVVCIPLANQVSYHIVSGDAPTHVVCIVLANQVTYPGASSEAPVRLCVSPL